MTKGRLAGYEQRTGDYLPLNILSKTSEVLGTLAFVGILLTEGSGKEAMVSAAFAVGGMIGDVSTGGLQPYPRDVQDRVE
jgi:hypothetical protein